jgi:asparagine synthase (glutamine-hydrolysing)
MSIIFGIRRSAGEEADEGELLTLASATHRYAHDGTFVRSVGNVGMGFQPYHAHQRSRLESQPAVDRLGNCLVLDGRLDNHADLRRELAIHDPDIADSNLILAAFERWGKGCFPRLIGDWALALYTRWDRVTYLARDHAGARTLYMQNRNGTLRWSTYLDTFFANGERYSLDDRYASTFLHGAPIGELTPYEGIRAVPAAHYVVVDGDKVTQAAHWNWIAKEQIRFGNDADYERQFFALFQQAVERRSSYGDPVIAELSGGMDSTAIVCMSDHVRRSQEMGTSELIDTVSYYVPNEPNWDEKPYFSITEARRGKRGVHIDTSVEAFDFGPVEDPALARAASIWPGMDQSTMTRERTLASAIGDQGYRAVLSGLGGDEVLGGVPTPLPELGDLLASGRLVRLFQQATAWSLSNRSPLLHTLYHTVRFTASLYLPLPAAPRVAPAWVGERLQIPGLTHDTKRKCRLGFRPSALCNGDTWWTIQETLPHRYPSLLERYEYRYPFLDRDLVDYLYRIPREQIVRVGRRRSLMRRALAAVLPPEILNRRRKAYISRSPIAAIGNVCSAVEMLIADSSAAEQGFLRKKELLHTLHRLINGEETGQLFPFMQAIYFEAWLRSAQQSLLCPVSQPDSNEHIDAKVTQRSRNRSPRAMSFGKPT